MFTSRFYVPQSEIMNDFLERVKGHISLSDWSDRSIGWFILSPDDFLGIEEIQPPPLVAVASHGQRRMISFVSGVAIEVTYENEMELLAMIKEMTDDSNDFKEE